MPRLPRYLLADGVWHVTGRAVAESPLFADDDDRRVFLWLLQHALREFHIECLGYCLMGTHYHLLLRGAQADLSLAMHRVNGRYADHFNRRQRRHGHLFGDRFAAYAIDDDDHLERAYRYIADNPVKAGLCRVARGVAVDVVLVRGETRAVLAPGCSVSM